MICAFNNKNIILKNKTCICILILFDGRKLGQVGSWVCPIFRLGRKLGQDLWSEDGAAQS